MNPVRPHDLRVNKDNGHIYLVLEMNSEYVRVRYLTHPFEEGKKTWPAHLVADDEFLTNLADQFPNVNWSRYP
jgi:hypothetical protein